MISFFFHADSTFLFVSKKPLSAGLTAWPVFFYSEFPDFLKLRLVFFFLRSVSSHFRLNIKQLSRYEKKKKQITRQHLLTSLHIWNHVSEIWVFFFKIRSVVGTLIKTALPVRVGVHVVDHVCASNVFNSLTLLTIRL